ncbi:MAG: cytochrome bd-I oxidase subunit CydX [Alphaproteobacteria bacterium]
MWYFAWVLGLGFAVLLSVVNAMWYEAQEDGETISNGGMNIRDAAIAE